MIPVNFKLVNGWDTTLTAYEQVKLSRLKLLEKLKAREEVYVFLQKGRTPETIGQDELRICVIL